MIKVTKGVHTRTIHAIDLSAWVRDGWEIETNATIKDAPTIVAPSPEKPAPVLDEAALTKELEGATWQELKALASELGLTKPDEKSWAEFIPDIVAAKLA